MIISNRVRFVQVFSPIEIYRHPQTSFTATFFGHTSVLADYQKYHTFQHMDGVEKAIVRPEFLKITKKNEVQKYGSSASQGVVERTSFRGDWIELEVRVNDDLLIAKRDLELRGAGNLLGAQQHGHMNAVGYDLYCKMLNEAVNELK